MKLTAEDLRTIAGWLDNPTDDADELVGTTWLAASELVQAISCGMRIELVKAPSHEVIPPRIKLSQWVSGRKLRRLRAVIRECPVEGYRKEGLASLRGRTKGEYLINLIPQNHPDRIGIIHWITSNGWRW